MRYEQTLLPGWQDWSGIGGRITPERVAALRRNQWQDWAGIRKADQLKHRGRSKAPDCRPVPRQCAKAPNELWSWDIS